MLFNDEQPENTPFPILVILLGKVIFVNEVQS